MGYDDDERGRRWVANIGIVLLIAAVAAVGFWVFSTDDAATTQIDLSEDVAAGGTGTEPAEAAARPSAAATTTATGVTRPTTVDADEADETDSTSSGASDDRDDAPTTTRAAASPAAASSTTDAGDAGDGGSEDGDAAPTTPGGVASGGPTLPLSPSLGDDDEAEEDDDTPLLTTSTTTSTTTAAATTVPTDGAAPYPTAPDGTPRPVIAVFDTDTVTVTGAVPSEEARQRLIALAHANSKTPVEVIDQMVINPAVPLSVGVRVLEMNSVRFPPRSARIEPPHAAELDRVVAIMNALPNITVLVVGHADQRGDDAQNFAISDERARAVVNYLRFLGISPTRLASRAAGESDLLTLGDDEQALALNRRTEFVFYGLLIP